MLKVTTVWDKINKAVLGEYNPVALVMTESEILDFAAEYAPQLWDNTEFGEDRNLIEILHTTLLSWPVLHLSSDGDRSAVPIRKLIYLAKQHYPDGHPPDMRAVPWAFHGDQKVDPVTLCDSAGATENARHNLQGALTHQFALSIGMTAISLVQNNSCYDN